MNEIRQVLKKDGVYFFTTNGDECAEFLLPKVKQHYERDGICIRSKVQEGKKMYGAWHHPRYVRETLLKGFALLEYLPPNGIKYVFEQDIWIARKKRQARKRLEP